MENLRPNKKRANIAMILIWIVIGIEILSLISGYLQYLLLNSISNGNVVSTPTANANDLREQIIAIAYMFTSVISGIMFIRWFRRAYFNLHLKVSKLNHSEGWAAGYWFVPIANFYRPYQIMKEMYVETSKIIGYTTKTDYSSRSLKTLVWWWSFWIISNLLGQFIFRYTMKAESIDELIISTISGITANIIGIPLAIITIKVIKNYSLMEDELINFKEEDSNNFIEI